jgi:hypothetical protein
MLSVITLAVMFCQLDNLMNVACLYLLAHHKKGKRHVKQQKFIWQNYPTKLKLVRIPDIVTYRHVLKASNDFLMAKYPILMDYMDEERLLYNEQDGVMVIQVQDACWAVHEHFMFQFNAQRQGQYKKISVNEFFLQLMCQEVNDPVLEPNNVCLS